MQELFQLRRVQEEPRADCAAGDLCGRVGAVAMLAWRDLGHPGQAARIGGYLICGLLLLLGLWIGYRLVNMPQFADFLIAVEAEMNKVSWPSARRVDSQRVRGDLRDLPAGRRALWVRLGLAAVVCAHRSAVRDDAVLTAAI